MAGTNNIKWRKAATFAFHRCTVSYGEHDGVRVQRMVFETRGGPAGEWRFNNEEYHLTAKGAENFVVKHIDLMPEMVAAFKSGKKSFKA